MIRSISGGRDRGHHVAARLRVPWPSWLGAGGAWGQRARRGRQPALCLSAPLTLAVRHGDVEGLIALIDTFPSRPTLGRPRLLPALLSFLCSGRKRGEVRPRHPWSRGWGRGRELCVARPGERWPYDDGEGEVGSFWGEGLEQAAFRSTAGIPQMQLLGVLVLLTTSHAGFLAPALLQGAAGMPCVSSGVISARGRTVALKPRRFLVVPCWFRALSVCWSPRAGCCAEHVGAFWSAPGRANGPWCHPDTPARLCSVRGKEQPLKQTPAGCLLCAPRRGVLGGHGGQMRFVNRVAPGLQPRRRGRDLPLTLPFLLWIYFKVCPFDV